jgi:hypothetical protein
MKFMKSSSAFSALMTGLLALIVSTCTDTTTGPGNGEIPPAPYSQTLAPGRSANDFLADSNFTTLAVEIDYMEGYAPLPDAIDSLRSFLQERLNKSQIIINEPTAIPSGGQQSYSADDVRSLEEQHRDLFTGYTDSDTLTAYMIILDGQYSSGNVLGIAYYNTSTAFFGETIRQVSSSGIAPPPRYKVEGTVFRHEFGHLFGLVNIEGSGTDMQNPHQDEANGHHCDNDQCLMYWAVETSDFFANLFDGNIPNLDQNCVLDLQANGGK